MAIVLQSVRQVFFCIISPYFLQVGVVLVTYRRKTNILNCIDFSKIFIIDFFFFWSNRISIMIEFN